jgi:ureidoglycolate lyase
MTGAPFVLVAQPLDAGAFAPFGRVVAAGVDPGRPVNEGRGTRIDLAAGLSHRTGAAEPSLALYRLDASHWPIEVQVMERHPQTAQMFLPLTGLDYLVLVAPDDAAGEPDMEQARAFVGVAGQGVVYAPGVWHLPMVALDRDATFAMLMWETGGPQDCETRRLPAPLLVTPPTPSPLRRTGTPLR